MKKINLYRLFLLVFAVLALLYTFTRIDSENIAQVFYLLRGHLFMVFVSMLIAIIIGISIGIILSRTGYKKFESISMYIVGLGQTIPSLAVLALSMSILGIGMKPAIFALTIYSVFPIARNTLSGLSSVSSDMIDAAKGLGIPPWKILWQIEIPNALAVIIAGVRTALVINIGTAALGAVIGAGGLGDQIFKGISFLNPWIMLSGAIPTAILALLGDYSLRWLESLLVSEGLKD
ncbi:MAG: ABC transporter permease [Halanaerobiaceae bacterium]